MRKAANKLYFDGGARPTNPGRSGYAAVLYMPSGEVVSRAEYIGWHSNNFAEYTGLVIGIKLAVAKIAFSTKLDIYTDSQLVWGHMTQGWARKQDELKMLARDAEKLLHAHYEDDETGEVRWTMQVVKRKDNSYADSLCTSAILKYREENPSPFSVLAGLR